ncbi:hypothetical protein [Methylobacterium longum]|uniref:hypothetical protein n=1 Tax=Methylobacterium longum TaxID=767694 RepID=UPI001EE28D6D|nr:hypothetical protein [Methylobacterium longum]
MAFTRGVLLVSLSGIFSAWVNSYLEESALDLLKAYWFADPGVRLKAALSWVIWSFVIDYVSLYKTRIVIKILRRHTRWGPLVCVSDFVAGFLVYIAGFTILSLRPVVLRSDWIWPPPASFELAMAFLLIVVFWGRALVPDIEAKAIDQGVPHEN